MQNKPVNRIDLRRTAYLRAPLEIAKTHGLTGLEQLAHAILWDCAGDWEEVEAFFAAPTLQRRDGWAPVWAFMIERRGFFDALFIETVKLYLQYRNGAARGGAA